MDQNIMGDLLKDHKHVEEVREVTGMKITFKTRTEYLPEELLLDIIEEYRGPHGLKIQNQELEPRLYRLSER